VDKPALYDEALEGCYSPTGLPTTGCCSLYKTRNFNFKIYLAMKMTGIYRFALLSDADEQLFVGHITKNVFPILQLTRITSGFTHTLLAMKSDLRQYAWIVTVTLVTDDGYDFDQNIERIQKSIAPFGLLVGTETHKNIVEA
jgi:hypothetical protein